MAIGEIISAGVGLIGSLFGKKKQTTTSSVDYGKMRDEATAAGFNPLTAIRNGGSAGFTTTSSPTISQSPELLANLGGVLGNALGEKLDPIEAKKREIDTLLVDRQLRSLKQGPQRQLTQPTTFEGVKVSQQLVPRAGVASVKKVASVPAAFKSDMGYEKDDVPKVKNPYPNGYVPDPNIPNADDIETRLGDDIMSPGFWYVGGSDIEHNLRLRGIPTGPNDMGRAIRKRLLKKPILDNASRMGGKIGGMIPPRLRRSRAVQAGKGGGGW